MRKQASLIDNRPTLEARKHVGKKLRKAVHCLDKALPNVDVE